MVDILVKVTAVINEKQRSRFSHKLNKVRQKSIVVIFLNASILAYIATEFWNRMTDLELPFAYYGAIALELVVKSALATVLFLYLERYLSFTRCCGGYHVAWNNPRLFFPQVSPII